MISKHTQLTIISRAILLLSNFLMIVYTTRCFGAEGRGVISYVLACVSIINILTNVSGGSTLTYHVPKFSTKELFTYHLFLSGFFALSGTLVMSIVTNGKFWSYIFFISLGYAWVNGVANIFLGKKLYVTYNALVVSLSVLPLIIFSILIAINYTLTLELYFYCMYASLAVLSIVGFVLMLKICGWPEAMLDTGKWKKLTMYGIKNELSYLLQFLSYRVSYFFILSKMGYSALGQFSVAIALAESIWVVSRSMSTIHYTDVLHSANMMENRRKTHRQALKGIFLSFLLAVIIFFVPSEWYIFLFGENFSSVKYLLTYILPGVLAIAFTNLHGHYFSAKGDQNILIIKSFIGLAANVVLLSLLIDTFKINAVFIATNVSYTISSVILAYYFYFVDRKRISCNS
ncbi:MAG: hypothetical protein NZ529_03330 [Cytophagaceae bacterium]|nr:hypothetical protein [Cytophagaceae bacterium]MDW8455801.1 hypothetical protein [Cytophagaceae bacterium]